MPSQPDMKHSEDQYSVLTQEDMNNPLRGLLEACNRHSLFAQRNQLFEFYRAALQSEAWEGDGPKEKADQLFFYSTAVYILELSYRIKEMIRDKELDILYTYPAPKTNPTPIPETNPSPIPERKAKCLRLSVRLREEFYEFVVNTSVSRMNKMFRDFVLTYLKDDPDGAELFFESMSYRDLTLIFHLLEIIEEEYKEEE